MRGGRHARPGYIISLPQCPRPKPSHKSVHTFAETSTYSLATSPFLLSSPPMPTLHMTTTVLYLLLSCPSFLSLHLWKHLLPLPTRNMPLRQLRRRNRQLTLLAPNLDVDRTLQLTHPAYYSVRDDGDGVVACVFGAGEGLRVVWGGGGVPGVD
jgi:hypothetical protein